MVGQYPLGGVAWDYFHYVLALAAMGHEVYYYEDTGAWPLDPVKGHPSDDGQYPIQFMGDFFRKHAPELQDRWHYVLIEKTHHGMSKAAFDEVAASADIFLNVSAACRIPQKLLRHLQSHWHHVWPQGTPGAQLRCGLSQRAAGHHER